VTPIILRWGQNYLVKSLTGEVFQQREVGYININILTCHLSGKYGIRLWETQHFQLYPSGDTALRTTKSPTKTAFSLNNVQLFSISK